MNETGLVSVSGAYTVNETLERLQSAIRAAGMTVFVVFDHAAAAKDAGLLLRPTTVVAFGNPAAGTKLMQANQEAGLDLPLKILVWQDESNTTRLTYNDPRWLAERHSLGTATESVIAAMARLLDSLVQQTGTAAARAS
jgi:uncharacterized protein (DUF302 family)